MHFEQLPIAGAFLVDQQLIADERGAFARAFCQDEFAEHGIDFSVRQANSSLNRRAGTVRGFHFQFPPHAEQKFLRCVRGALVDVPVELSADNRRAVLIPARCAHALQTLVADTEALYLVSEFYTPGAECGLRYDDPMLAIDWPLAVSDISAKDAAWPLLAEQLPTLRERMGATPEGQATR
jgi:dTDP-4-dehydrorhamnose 3,5-epimerase